MASPRKTRSDKGKKRKPIGARIRSAALNTAKYGAGLYVGSKIYKAGSKAGEALTNKIASKIKPDAVEGSLVDRAKTLGKTVGTIIVADQTVRGANAASRLIQERRRKRQEEGRKRK